MALYISVVNHSHDEIIVKSNTLSNLAKEYCVVIKSNTEPKAVLTEYCNRNDIVLLRSEEKKGFGANNNEVFDYAINNTDMSGNDYFLVLNPDVDVTTSSIKQLLNNVKSNNSKISTINLFKDVGSTIYDNAIKQFPHPLAPFKSLLGISRTDHYSKDDIKKPTSVDWAAGSFLLFKVSVYQKLNGFDDKYFMYFEDVDICKRASDNGYTTIYFPDIKAVHYAAFDNRNILSKAFLWYITSYMRYHFNNFTRQLRR